MTREEIVYWLAVIADVAGLELWGLHGVIHRDSLDMWAFERLYLSKARDWRVAGRETFVRQYAFAAWLLRQARHLEQP